MEYGTERPQRVTLLIYVCTSNTSILCDCSCVQPNVYLHTKANQGSFLSQVMKKQR